MKELSDTTYPIGELTILITELCNWKESSVIELEGSWFELENSLFELERSLKNSKLPILTYP